MLKCYSKTFAIFKLLGQRHAVMFADQNKKQDTF